MDKETRTSSDADPIDPRIRRETEQAFQRISNNSAAERLWHNYLTPGDRARLGGDIENAWLEPGHTVGMFMRARGVGQIEAIIQIAALLGFLRDVDRDRLLRGWGLPMLSAPPDHRPAWNPETGRLYWGQTVIRTVRLFKKPSNLQVLIEEFQAAEWVEIINSPFEKPETLHDAVSDLNEGLTQIRFSATGGAKRCRWELMQPHLPTQ